MKRKRKLKKQSDYAKKLAYILCGFDLAMDEIDCITGVFNL